MRSHIDWREERVPARMLGPKGGELFDSISVREGNKVFFTRVWKSLPSICVLKTLRESPGNIY